MAAALHASILTAVAVLGLTPAAATPRLLAGAPVTLAGEVAGRGDLSAAAFIHGFLAIGSDEAQGRGGNRKNVIQLLRPDGGGNHVVFRTIALCTALDADGDCELEKERKELDLEGMAAAGTFLYVIGSHAATRKRVRCDPADACAGDCRKPRTYAENRSLFEGESRTDEDRPKPGRNRLLRLDIDADGNVSTVAEISLAAYLDQSAVFRQFSRIPSKENGVDIEGLAVREGVLHIGFRGPVYRGGYVPILKLGFEAGPPTDDDISYVNLGGLGVRSIAAVSDGFLVIAGPVGDGPATFRLFHWDGRDMLPGNGHRREPIGRIRFLGDVPRPACANPEGLAVIDETATAFEVIIVYDGTPETPLRRLRVER